MISIKCPDCSPGSWAEPSEVWPFWVHVFSGMSLIEKTDQKELARLIDNWN
jgi:hypothetical protein